MKIAAIIHHERIGRHTVFLAQRALSVCRNIGKNFIISGPENQSRYSIRNMFQQSVHQNGDSGRMTHERAIARGMNQVREEHRVLHLRINFIHGFITPAF